MNAMNSHDVAKALLNLPNKTLLIVCHVDGEYVQVKYVNSMPWEDLCGDIRLQPESADEELNKTKGGSSE